MPTPGPPLIPACQPLLPVLDELGHRTAPLAPWPEVHGELERKQAGARVRELIHRLPESDRTVRLPRGIEELDTAKTAEALGISENAVKTRLHRARQALRTLRALATYRETVTPEHEAQVLSEAWTEV